MIIKNQDRNPIRYPPKNNYTGVLTMWQHFFHSLTNIQRTAQKFALGLCNWLGLWLSNNECKQIIPIFSYIWHWQVSWLRGHPCVGSTRYELLFSESLFHGHTLSCRLKLWSTTLAFANLTYHFVQPWWLHIHQVSVYPKWCTVQFNFACAVISWMPMPVIALSINKGDIPAHGLKCTTCLQLAQWVYPLKTSGTLEPELVVLVGKWNVVVLLWPLCQL